MINISEITCPKCGYCPLHHRHDRTCCRLLVRPAGGGYRLGQQIEELEQRLAEFREDVGPEVHDDGSWTWRIGAGADQAVAESFSIDGAEDFQVSTARKDGRTHLVLTATDELTFIHTGRNLAAIDGRAEVNLSEFDGDFLLIHHFTDSENYQFIRISGSELQQGQMINRSDNLLGSDSINRDGWSTFRVTASGRNFYGYQNGNTIVHTHADEMEAGKSRFAISGSGVLKVRLEFN